MIFGHIARKDNEVGRVGLYMLRVEVGLNGRDRRSAKTQQLTHSNLRFSISFLAARRVGHVPRSGPVRAGEVNIIPDKRYFELVRRTLPFTVSLSSPGEEEDKQKPRASFDFITQRREASSTGLEDRV